MMSENVKMSYKNIFTCIMKNVTDGNWYGSVPGDESLVTTASADLIDQWH